MDEFRFFTFTLPGSDERFNERLTSLSDSIHKQKVSNPPWVAALGPSTVQQIAIASSHIAILLEDGRMCRIGYSLNVEHLEQNKHEDKSCWSAKKPKKKSARLVAGITGSERTPYRRNVTSATLGSSGALGSGATSASSSRNARPNYRNLFMSTVPFIPPSQVPEDLIVQVQNVLQGKSRSLIIRELQRTNLDVNSAVNNLLSRDDEEADDDEGGDLFADDLMSFVESNLSERAGNYILESDQMLVEDYLNYATTYRSSSSNTAGRHRLSLRNEILRSSGNASVSGGTDSSENPPRGDDFGRRWLESRLRDPLTAHITSTTVSSSGAGNNSNNSLSGNMQSSFSETVQPWEVAGVTPVSRTRGATAISGGSTDAILWEEPEWFILLPDAVSSPQPKFIQIAAMHSELVALSKHGKVYQWKWNVSMPFVHPDIADVHHPRIAHLDLQNEFIVSLAASALRCSVVTQTGRVATWMDPIVASYCGKLEHGPTPLLDSSAYETSAIDLIKEMKVCDLFTVVATNNSRLYWWGVAPFSQRRKLLEKQATKSSSRSSVTETSLSSASRDSQTQLAITEGCTVTKKKSPMYHAGAIGFCDYTFPPKVGQLMEDIWNLDASCRFKILPMEKKRNDSKKTEMLPPPSPVSVGSEGSHKSTSRKRRRSVSPHPFAQAVEEEVEELWNPRHVVFLEDSQSIPVGIVLKVDGNIAAVRFRSEKSQPGVPSCPVSSANNSDNSNHSITEDQSSILKDCRLFHKSELQALRPNSLPKFMDCIQKTPKNIFAQAATEKFHLLAFSVDTKGVHVICNGIQSKFYYTVIEPSTGHILERRVFFTDVPAFVGMKDPITLQVAPEEPGRLLTDGNGCFYPLCKDDAGQMRDPPAVNMLPVKTSAMGVHYLREGLSSVHRVLFTAFIPKLAPTMAAVFQCNQHFLEMRLAEYELNPDKEGPAIVAERCDGNRNILHALVYIGRPVTNKADQGCSSGSTSQSKSSKEESSSSASARQNMNSSSGANTTSQASADNPITSIVNSNLLPSSSVLAQFDQSLVASSVASNSLTASSNALQNGAEILRRLREATAVAEAARRSVAGSASTVNFDSIPTLAWPPDPPAYESIPLSSAPILDVQPRSIGPLLTSTAASSGVSAPSAVSASKPSLISHLSSRSSGATSAANASSSSSLNSDEDRKKVSLKMLITLLTFNRANFEKSLVELLSLQDGKGMTPLMLAINLKCYNMAVQIFNAAKRLATDSKGHINDDVLMKMVFPPALGLNRTGAKTAQNMAAFSNRQQLMRRDDPDQSPLYMICCNDNCSFTWTGDLHINQDIFECKTCGLHDTYCCCTECAKNCHRGHDCKLKKTWPTAYCDCWRRGRCCALIEGDQSARFNLLSDLLQHTNLASLPNRKGEHLLLFLVNTLSRQMLEQSGLSKAPGGSSATGGSNAGAGSKSARHHNNENENIEGMPDHNLEPPKFCRKALCLIVTNWKAVSSLMLQSANSNDSSDAQSPVDSDFGAYNDLSPLQSSYLKSQTGSAKLDAFTYKLIVKCKNETGFVTLEKLCETLLAHLKVPLKSQESILVARRFVRSVCRVFVVLSMESQSSKNKAIASEPLRKCKTVFRILMGVAIEELIETADCLLAPVRMGISRPTRPFTCLSSTEEKQGSAELFSIEPLPPRRSVAFNETARNRTRSTRGHEQGISNDPVDEINFNSRGSSRDRTVATSSNQEAAEANQTSSNNEAIPGLNLSTLNVLSEPLLADLSGDGEDRMRFLGGSSASHSNTARQDNSNDMMADVHIDDYQDDPDLNDNDDLDDDGRGSSADGGVGDDDVTFDVDMMEEESDGGDNSDEDEEDDDDDLDPPSGGEEQPLMHMDQGGNTRAGASQPNTVSGSSHDRRIENLQSPTIGGRPQADLSRPHSPAMDTTHATIGSTGELYFSGNSLGQSANQPGRDRAIIGGGAGGLLSDGEESRSSSQDDESEAGGDNRGDHDMVEDLYSTESTIDVTTDTVSTSQNVNRHVPQGIQWAVGGQPVVVPAPPARGMIYVDPSTIRRGGVSNAAAAADAASSWIAAPVNLGAGVPGAAVTSSTPAELTCSSTATNVSLSRAFSLVIRSVTELIFLAAEEETDGGYMTQQQFDALQDYVDKRLHITWEWLSSVMDSTEAQLRFGAALINSTDTSHPSHPLNAANQRRTNNSSNTSGQSSSGNGNNSNSLSNSRRGFEGVSRSSRAAQQDSAAARKDFLNYVLSLMRAHSNEHADSLPVIDISAFKHIAYVLDAMVYYLKNGKDAVVKAQDMELTGPGGDLNSVIDEFDEYDNEDDSLDEAIYVGLKTGLNCVDDFTPASGMTSRKGFSFFRRSPSTLCLGAASTDPFELPLNEALPLAERPQLLTPHASKEEMFGSARFDGCLTTEGPEATNNGDSNQTITIERVQVEVVPLQMGMDERIDSAWENLVGIGENDDDLPQHGTTQASNVEFGIGNCNNDDLSPIGDTFSGLQDNVNPEVLLDSENSPEDEDYEETGALDMSSSTLNAAEAAERQLQGTGQDDDSPGENQTVAASQTVVSMDVERSNTSQSNVDVGGIIGSSTPNRSQDVSAPTSNTARAVDDLPEVQEGIEICVSSNQAEQSVVEKSEATYTTLRRMPRVPDVVSINFSRDVLLGRWASSLELFGRVFIEDVGSQPGSLLAEISSFDVREARFKKEMERIRNSQTRDLALEVERDRHQLILQTMKQLNSQYSKRSSFPGQPLAVHKVKVTFKNEPGEGTGVSRSFYTAIAEALLADAYLPKLDSLSGTNMNSTQMSRIRKTRSTGAVVANVTTTPASSSIPSSHDRRNTISHVHANTESARTGRSISNPAGGATSSSLPRLPITSLTTPSSSSSANAQNSLNSSFASLNVNAAPYQPNNLEEDSLVASVYAGVMALHPQHASKITGMLMELDCQQLIQIKNNPDRFAENVEEALGLIMSCGGLNNTMAGSSSTPSGAAGGAINLAAAAAATIAPDDDECAPLFYQPGRAGFYCPRLGKCTKERLDVFRNVGRLIGLCLLQNELIPLPFNRHVLKYILHKELSWHDFAFFDPVMYESMRKLVLDAANPDATEMFKELGLSYSVVLRKEEGGGEVDLVPMGSQYEVTPKNVIDFVRRYCEHRMRVTMEKPLRMLRRGVYEVVPPSALSDLTAEDLRLLLNGTVTIDCKQLMSFTNFIDETGEDNPEKIKKFKRSFWCILERMPQKDLQDLMYFWTGSPSVPASEEGFQPMPSITLRPADDSYFPTANTCISRLYIPLYSSKAQLKTKLTQAIQVKSFGFV